MRATLKHTQDLFLEAHMCTHVHANLGLLSISFQKEFSYTLRIRTEMNIRVPVCNLSTREAEAGGLQTLDQNGLHCGTLFP